MTSTRRTQSSINKHPVRRALAATFAGAGVALIGVGAVSPATAQAAGVTSGYRFVPTSTTSSATSPATAIPSAAALNAGSSTLRYTVGADDTLRRI